MKSQKMNSIDYLDRRIKLIKKWLEINNNSCPVCGKLMNEDDCEINHIIPPSMGGETSIDNIQILCKRCNSAISNKPFLGYQFVEYVKKLLIENDKYSNVYEYMQLEETVLNPDIIFEKEANLYFASVSIGNTCTEKQIIKAINNLAECKLYYPSSKLVYIIVGYLPEKYIELLKNNGIEIWDKNYLNKEFRKQIENTKPTFFKTFFDSPKNLENAKDKWFCLINKLKFCPTGWNNWVEYQNIIEDILEIIFCPPLNSPTSQSNDKTKTNRRDFVLANYTKENNNWKFLRERYCADYVVVDAKNSGKYITKNDVLQIGNYLKKEGTGLFGIIIARKGPNKSAEITLRDLWIHQQKMIVVLNDIDVEQMILAKRNGDDPSELILKKIEEFRLVI